MVESRRFDESPQYNSMWQGLLEDLGLFLPHDLCVVALRPTPDEALTLTLVAGPQASDHLKATNTWLALAALVARSREPLVLQDDLVATLAARGLRAAPELAALCWTLGVPLLLHEAPVGALLVSGNDSPAPIAMLPALRAVARQAVLRWHAEQESAAAQTRAATWEALAVANRLPDAECAAEPALERLARIACELLPAEGSVVHLQENGALIPHAAAGVLAAAATPLPHTAIAVRALAENRLLGCDDLLASAAPAPALQAALQALNLRACLSAPLREDGRAIGTLDVVFRRGGLPSAEQERLLAALAEQAALSLRDGRNQAALQQSEARSHLLAEAVARAADGIAIVDLDGCFITANAAYATLLGFSEAELIGRPITLVSAGAPESQAERMARRALLEREGQWAGPVQRRRKDGTLIDCWLSLALIRDAQNTPIAIVRVLRDLSASRQLEAQLAEAEKLRALGELAAGVAHNFNNVLEALLGRADLLLAQALDPEIHEHLQFMRQAAEDGAAIVRRIQSFARTTGEAERTAVDVRALLRDALAMTEPRWRDAAQRRGAAIEVHSEVGEVPEVEGNASELREVLVNLINNAVDAMPSGGVLRLRSRRVGERVEIDIADTGSGIPPELQTRIFEPFFSTKAARGAGLGLAVTQGILTRNGATLNVQSSLKHGTTMTVSLPSALRASLASLPLPAVKTSTPGALPSVHVLVVDDDPRLAELLATMLQRQGHTAVIRTSAAAALEAARETRFDVVLSDVGMPGLNGFDLARTLRKRQPDLPIGLVSGWGESIPEQEWRAVGADGLLPKPFGMAEVQGLLAALLERRPVRKGARHAAKGSTALGN